MKTLAWITSFIIGFASLGQEILWVRIVAFANGNTPQTFALVLGIFLFGIVLGAVAGKKICETGDLLLIRQRAAWTLIISGALDLGAPWLLTSIHTDFWLTHLMGLMILATSATKATLFPVVHHLGSHSHTPDLGRSISRVYFLNIAGATLSPIIIGFWLLDYWSSQSIMQFLGAITLLTAALIHPWRRWSPVFLAGASSALILTNLHPQQYSLIRALAYKSGNDTLAFVLENRQGVIHTLRNPNLGDAVFGGNMYDGRINTDLIRNSNRIDRLYLLSALHPNPKRILVIGLSGGAWTRVLAEFPGVEHIDVIEINPGYIQLIRSQPEVRPILENRRIHIHIDDGRRWLRRHTGEGYDLIVMNTTFHWRAYITNLLSADFLRIARRHLKPGGILAFNSTGSPDALMTAASVFPHAYRWRNSNFVYASDLDFRSAPQDTARERLLSLSAKLQLTHSYSHEELVKTVEHLLSIDWIDTAEESRIAQRPLEIITDQNMLTEFKWGRVALW